MQNNNQMGPNSMGEIVNGPVNVAKPKSNKTLILIIIALFILLFCCALSVIAGLFIASSGKGSNVDTTPHGTMQNTATPTATPSTVTTTNANPTKKIPTSSPTEVSGIKDPNFNDMPGSTTCDALLCSDTWTNIKALAPIYFSGCQSLSLTDTELISQSKDNTSFKEVWTVSGCKKDVQFDVAYTVDPTGGTNYAVSKKS